ncbi:hypothetical protein GCM10028817_30450 [Spirosoma pomorum]
MLAGIPLTGTNQTKARFWSGDDLSKPIGIAFRPSGYCKYRWHSYYKPEFVKRAAVVDEK